MVAIEVQVQLLISRTRRSTCTLGSAAQRVAAPRGPAAPPNQQRTWPRSPYLTDAQVHPRPYEVVELLWETSMQFYTFWHRDKMDLLLWNLVDLFLIDYAWSWTNEVMVCFWHRDKVDLLLWNRVYLLLIDYAWSRTNEIMMCFVVKYIDILKAKMLLTNNVLLCYALAAIYCGLS